MKYWVSISLLLPLLLLAQELDESFDPTTLNDWQDTKGYLETMKPKSSYLQDRREHPDSRAAPVSARYVYRVQLGSTTDYDEAISFEESAAGTFNEEVMVQFDSPNYKIRVGNLKSREDAQLLQEYAIKSGYRRAWVIRTENTAVQKN